MLMCDGNCKIARNMDIEFELNNDNVNKISFQLSNNN